MSPGEHLYPLGSKDIDAKSSMSQEKDILLHLHILQFNFHRQPEFLLSITIDSDFKINNFSVITFKFV